MRKAEHGRHTFFLCPFYILPPHPTRLIFMFSFVPSETVTPEFNLEANSFSTTLGAVPQKPNGQRPMFYEFKPKETVKAQHGPELRFKTWEAEAALRMLENNLDPALSLVYDELIVYGGAGRAARN